MNLRTLLNVSYAHLVKMVGRELIDEILAEKRWSEMTDFERGRAERKRMAIASGAYQGQKALVGAMGLPQGRRR